MSDVVQYIIIRKDLDMPVGKIASQAAHASMSVFLSKGVLSNSRSDYPSTFHNKLLVDIDADMKEWIEGDFTKIVLYVKSEHHLDNLYTEAYSEGFPCSLITDNGTTVFDGVKTKTAMAIGPCKRSTVKHLVGKLRLL